MGLAKDKGLVRFQSLSIQCGLEADAGPSLIMEVWDTRTGKRKGKQQFG